MNKSAAALVALFMMVLVLAMAFSFYDRSTIGVINIPEVAITIRGTIETVESDRHEVLIRRNDKSLMLVSIGDKALIHDSLGATTSIDRLTSGTEVSVIGIRVSSTRLNASSLLVSHDVHSDWPVQPDNVFEASLIPLSYAVTGLANLDWYKGGFFYIKVFDGKGELINRARAYPIEKLTASSTRLAFKAWIGFDLPETATGTIRFEQAEAIGTSSAGFLEIPIRFQQWQNQTTSL